TNFSTSHVAAKTIVGTIGPDSFIGSSLSDSLSGADGNDRIEGGGAADTLSGGVGADTFVYRHSSDGADIIADFRADQGDQLLIFASGFGGGLVAGSLAANRLVSAIGATANQGFGQFLFDEATKVLSWDGDGTGAVNAITIATLTNVQ